MKGIANGNIDGTDIRNFMAYRGAIVAKEFRSIGSCQCEFHTSMDIETIILTIVKGERREIKFGVKVLHKFDNGRDEVSVCLDFDEIEELIQALHFIAKTAAEIISTERDYTEVVYATKDNATFGFYQDANKQTAFFCLSPRKTGFLSFDTLGEVSKILHAARTHLVNHGAQVSYK